MAESLLPDPLTVAGLLPPYALSLGMAVDRIENGVPVLGLDFAEKVHGRPGFLHGGAIAGLLEMAAFAALRVELRRRGAPDSMAGARLKPVNISVEYLRGGTAQRTYAIGRVTRAGRRIANVSAEAWQDDPARPIASAWLNVMLTRAEG